MDEALRRFALYLKRHFGQSSTAKHYLSDLTIFVDIIGKKAPEDVTPVDIDAFIDHQLAPVIWRRHRLKTGTHLPRDARDSNVTRLFAVIEDVRDQVIYGLMVGAGV
jgi:hypothetical protein